MKTLTIILLLSFPALFPREATTESNKQSRPAMPDTRIIIKVNNKSFDATLLDNPTAKAFTSMLPLNLSMVELNGNEKYGELPSRLPTNSANPRQIQNGDIMLYGSSTLVLFYKSFPTSYSYTKLGQLDDPTGFAAALGSGNVNVAIEVR